MAVNPFEPPELRGLGRSRRLLTVPVPERKRRKLAGKFALTALLVLAVVTGSLAGLTLVYSVDLPQIHDLERYRPSTMTDLYDRNGHIIGSFALERRVVVDYSDFAPILRQAVISIEDKSFESHWGVNVLRVAGAVWHDLRTHGRAQGASTLTMQLARNLFLSSERTAARKVQEAYLAIQIERAFTKQQIFTLYGNQIYLGHGMYGFEAASEFYFSKHARDLTLTEAALLAGLPKGPVAFSPLLNPDKALHRRNLVLTEMEMDKVISHAQAEQARKAPLGLRIAQPEMSVAPWFQEEVRRELEKQFGAEQVHEAGLKVETTLDLELQKTANVAVADGLATYERRRGWVGKLDNVLAAGDTIENYRHPDWAMRTGPGDYVHAVVTRALPSEIRARVGATDILLLPEDWRWTGQPHGDMLVKPGDLIYIHLSDTMAGTAVRATLEQDSGTQGSLLAIDNTTGDVLAMVGGRDYALSQFNRATQSERQTGSSFKPYVYTAAVEDGAKPDDMIVDEPVSFGSYTPHNYEGDYKGRMTLTNAFAESRNIPALKLADRVGIHKVIDVAHRFGVTSNIPAYLPVALGAVEITLEEQVASYSVFPNDGLRVRPRIVRKVSNADGITLWEDPPAVDNVISQQTARTMMTLMQAVTQHGTGAAAAQLNHPLGGKTGTTSDYTDAWFLGFSPSVTCGVWVGFDTNESLGPKETGAKAALPIWMTWMRAAIVGKDDEKFLGDDNDRSLLEASAQRPNKFGATGAAIKSQSPASQSPVRFGSNGIVVRPPAAPFAANPPANADVSVRPFTTTPPSLPAKPPAQPAKPVVQQAGSTSTIKSRIRAAILPQPTPRSFAGTIKTVITPANPLASPGAFGPAGRPPTQAVPSSHLISSGTPAKPPSQAVPSSHLYSGPAPKPAAQAVPAAHLITTGPPAKPAAQAVPPPHLISNGPAAKPTLQAVPSSHLYSGPSPKPAAQAVPAAHLITTGPPAKPTGQAVTKPPLHQADGSPSDKSHVKVVVMPQATSTKPKAAVKPAIAPAPEPKKPKDQP
ncbi:MAG: PBP1A family penicillin-binding protein [Terracidiphilus sp.]